MSPRRMGRTFTDVDQKLAVRDGGFSSRKFGFSPVYPFNDFILTMAGPKAGEKAGAKSGPSALVQLYLTLYNFGSATAWGFTLFLLVKSVFETNVKQSYDACGWTVTVVQSVAILEVLHALFGLVKTPVVTTVIQVSSRLLLVWGVTYPFNIPEVREHWAFTTMVGAWCVAEIVRYLYYGFNLLGSQPAWLIWCRYNFFFILYPVGAGSEWILLIQSLSAVRQFDERLWALYVIIAGLYPPGLFKMYSHMMGQRRKYLKGTQESKTKKRA
ncbi:very-long-chain (3R)-3-hydroxyacyl-CoA dehydratase [Spizellomyces sp. 'palustris']|nr:very-long-chain (3R)-3-hydroxyacyl-CoA dehydratase [Spizellomyces sp. 'palustris']